MTKTQSKQVQKWIEKYIKSDIQKKEMCDLIAKTDGIMAHHIAKEMGINISTTAFVLRKLMLDGYVERISTRHPTMNKAMLLFKLTDLKFVPRTMAQLDVEIEIRKQKQAKTIESVNNKSLHPNGRIIRNLDRPGSDYAWQRKKRKHSIVGIGSSFSLYDGA